MKSLRVAFDLENLVCIDEADGPGNAEPYLWTVFFKVDGDTTVVNESFQLEGEAVVVPTSGTHKNIGNVSVGDRDVVPIPDFVGRWETRLRPIRLVEPVLDTAFVGGVAGALVVLMEQDSTPMKAVLAGYNSLVNGLRDELNAIIPTLGIAKPTIPDHEIDLMSERIGQKVRSAMRNALGLGDLLSNQDDKVGQVVFRFGHSELEEHLNSNLTLSHTWDPDDHGKWRVEGNVSVKPFVIGPEHPYFNDTIIVTATTAGNQ